MLLCDLINYRPVYTDKQHLICSYITSCPASGSWRRFWHILLPKLRLFNFLVCTCISCKGHTPVKSWSIYILRTFTCAALISPSTFIRMIEWHNFKEGKTCLFWNDCFITQWQHRFLLCVNVNPAESCVVSVFWWFFTFQLFLVGRWSNMISVLCNYCQQVMWIMQIHI